MYNSCFCLIFKTYFLLDWSCRINVIPKPIACLFRRRKKTVFEVSLPPFLCNFLPPIVLVAVYHIINVLRFILCWLDKTIITLIVFNYGLGFRKRRQPAQNLSKLETLKPTHDYFVHISYCISIISSVYNLQTEDEDVQTITCYCHVKKCN